MIPIRLKIREGTRNICAHPDETVQSVKQREFPNEHTRFLHFGREIHDSMTFRKARVAANDVIMVSIATKDQNRTAAAVHEPNQNSSLSSCDLLTLILSMICFLVWTVAYSIPNVFSLQSIIMLVPLTIALLGASYVRLTSPA